MKNAEKPPCLVPVFEVKAKINGSVPSNVINRSKSVAYSTN